MRKDILSLLLIMFLAVSCSICAGTSPHSFQVQGKPFVDVKQFGAKGDGVTDDRAAVQSAIDYCVTNKIALFISKPSAHYAIKSMHPTAISCGLYIGADDFAMFGTCAKSAEQTADLFGDFVTGSAPLTFLRIVGRGTILRDISFRSVNTRHTVYYPGATSGLQITGCTFEGDYFYNPTAPEYGLFINGAILSNISFNRFRGNLTGLYIGPTSTSLVLQGNYARGNRDYGYYIRGAFYSSLISNAVDSIARLSGVEYSGQGVGYYIHNCTGISLQGCGTEVVKTAIKIENSSITISDFVAVSVGSASGSPIIDMLPGQEAHKNVLISNFRHEDPGTFTYFVGGAPRNLQIDHTDYARNHIGFVDFENVKTIIDSDNFSGTLSASASTQLVIPIYSKSGRWSTGVINISGRERQKISGRLPHSFSTQLTFNEESGNIPYLSASPSVGITSVATSPYTITLLLADTYAVDVDVEVSFKSGNAFFGVDYASSAFKLN